MARMGANKKEETSGKEREVIGQFVNWEVQWGSTIFALFTRDGALKAVHPMNPFPLSEISVREWHE
jgi:hypothetical protein